MSVPIRTLAAIFLVLAGNSLLAGAQYEISWIATRGTASDNGASLGAYTITNTLWAFEGANIAGDFTSTMTFPDMVMDPASTPASQSWSNGSGDDGLLGYFFLPVDGSGNPTQQPLVLDSSDLQNGNAAFSVTNNAGVLRFNGTVAYTDPSTNGAAMMNISGTVTQGTGGAPDAAHASWVIREGSLVISANASGTATVIPEPSTTVTGLAGALLLAGVAAARRNRQSRIKGSSYSA